MIASQLLPISVYKFSLWNLQGLQQKLSDCLPLEDNLKSLSAQLLSVSDEAAAEQLVSDVDSIKSHHASTLAEVEANIQRLQDLVKSWGDVTAEMEACSLTLKDAQLTLTDAVPHHQQDLLLESDRLQVVTAAVYVCMSYCLYEPSV